MDVPSAFLACTLRDLGQEEPLLLSKKLGHQPLTGRTSDFSEGIGHLPSKAKHAWVWPVHGWKTCLNIQGLQQWLSGLSDSLQTEPSDTQFCQQAHS